MARPVLALGAVGPSVVPPHAPRAGLGRTQAPGESLAPPRALAAPAARAKTAAQSRTLGGPTCPAARPARERRHELRPTPRGLPASVTVLRTRTPSSWIGPGTRRTSPRPSPTPWPTGTHWTSFTPKNGPAASTQSRKCLNIYLCEQVLFFIHICLVPPAYCDNAVLPTRRRHCVLPQLC